MAVSRRTVKAASLRVIVDENVDFIDILMEQHGSLLSEEPTIMDCEFQNVLYQEKLYYNNLHFYPLIC